MVGGLSGKRGPSQDHQHVQLPDHLLCLLQTVSIITATVIAFIQGLDLNEDHSGQDGRLALLYHHPEGVWRDVDEDQFLVVIDHAPIHILYLLAHVRPEDAGKSLPRHHQASHHLHRLNIALKSEEAPLIHGRGLPPEIVIGGEVARIEDLEDQTHFTHRTIEEYHGLMLLRVPPHETIVG